MARRNEVWPPERRGASRLTPYVRHGLMWQEYARRVYARLGARLGGPLRASAPRLGGPHPERAWDPAHGVRHLTLGELERGGGW